MKNDAEVKFRQRFRQRVTTPNDIVRLAPEGAKRAIMPLRDLIAAKKTNQLWAILRSSNPNSNGVYWAKCELRKRGYCV